MCTQQVGTEVGVCTQKAQVGARPAAARRHLKRMARETRRQGLGGQIPTQRTTGQTGQTWTVCLICRQRQHPVMNLTRPLRLTRSLLLQHLALDSRCSPPIQVPSQTHWPHRETLLLTHSSVPTFCVPSPDLPSASRCRLHSSRR